MKYTVVMPFVDREYADKCIKSMKFDPDSVLLVDNTTDNIGIMKSHNLGIDKMIADDSDWLIILSASVVFGEKGGLDFIAELEKRSDFVVVEAAGVFGWHLIAFNRKTIEKVGRWDENFTPYGYDDLDLSWRIQLAIKTTPARPLWEKVPVDLKDKGMGHSIKLGKIKTQDNNKLRRYFVEKWGGIHPPIYKHPFNDKNNSVKYFPKPDDPNGINNIKTTKILNEKLNNCQAGHKKHDRLVVDTSLGKMTVYDHEKYKDQFNTYCTGQDGLSFTLINSGCWEEHYLDLATSILKDGDRENLVIDIGAHIGWYSRMATQLGYKVIAFEGDAENMEVLKLNAPGVDARHAWFEEDMEGVFESDKTIEFMKLDIEGSEKYAIEYMRDVLARTKNILIEVSPIFNGSYPALMKKLQNLGFEILEIDGTRFDFDFDFPQKDLWLRKVL